ALLAVKGMETSGSSLSLRVSVVGTALLGLLLGGGCTVGSTAEAAFATDFKCESPVTSRWSDAAGRVRITGCGHEATYQCYNGVCSIQTADSSGSARSSAEGDGDLRPKAPRPTPSQPEVRVENTGDDAMLVLELVLARAVLRLTATPAKRPDIVQLKLVRFERSTEDDQCNLDWMLNGQVIATPKSTATRKGNELAQRVQFDPDLIAELATAEKIALRACDERWALSPEQVQRVRQFIDRFHEEVAWKAPPRGDSSGGMLPPSGGWAAWTAVSPLPKSVDGPALDARALFKKLSVSVFQLEATREQGKSQGSAVAIGQTELLTNCHVVKGALKLVLRQGKKTWAGKLVSADPATDRCVVTGTDLKLQPVAGVRSYDSLEVGEAAYTLGSPVGLELTLSNGIISGRRTEQGRNYVQTTAPISPGSSGGGLFDAHGNLVGITTLVLVGREHLNQSLNFAIPADAFFQR
ncbi:MAG TPA: trypsin-like peptidase domain-containing protein, partial [Polyangiaceae bacterium]